MKKRSSRGFTLIELMIVTAILGILAAVIIPELEKYSEGKKNINLPVKTHEQVMLDYVNRFRPDLYEWIGPDCRGISDYPTSYGLLRCTASGMDNNNRREIIVADCIAGEDYKGNEGCDIVTTR